MPEQVREFHEKRRQERGRSALNEALARSSSVASRAPEKSAVEALELGESPTLSAVLAARAAHELKAFEKRDDYLTRAGEVKSSDSDLPLVARLELLAEQQRFDEALTSLQGVQHRHPAVLGSSSSCSSD